MTVPLLDLKAQYAALKAELDAAVLRVAESQYFILGPEVAALERAMEGYLEVRHALGVSSGTDALLLALMALGVGAGDEVIVPTFSFFATAGVVSRLGARPVLVDIDPVSYNIDPGAVAAAVTSRTRAIVPVHLYGQSADMDALLAIGAEHGVPVVEDAAQAIGVRYKDGRRCGSMGTVGCFSFFPSKNLGGYGDGGMMVTQDDALAARLKRLRVHGGLQMYHHEEVGFNSRLDALQAAVLSAKLPHLHHWSAGRRANAAYYTSNLADVAEVRTPVIDPANESIFNQYTLRVERRDDLQAHLKAKGIGSAVYYPVPLHLQPCFAYLGYGEGAFPESEKAAKEVLSIPIYPEMTSSQLDEVVGAIRAFYGR